MQIKPKPTSQIFSCQIHYFQSICLGFQFSRTPYFRLRYLYKLYLSDSSLNTDLFHISRCEPGMHPRLRWQRSVASKKEYLLQRLRKFEIFSRKHRTIKHIKKSKKKYKKSESEYLRPKRSVPTSSSEESAEEIQDERKKRKSKRALLMGHQTQQRQQMINRRKDGGRDSKKKGRGGGGGNGGDDDDEDDRGGEKVNKVKAGRGKGKPFFLSFFTSIIIFSMVV